MLQFQWLREGSLRDHPSEVQVSPVKHAPKQAVKPPTANQRIGTGLQWSCTQLFWKPKLFWKPIHSVLLRHTQPPSTLPLVNKPMVFSGGPCAMHLYGSLSSAEGRTTWFWHLEFLFFPLTGADVLGPYCKDPG